MQVPYVEVLHELNRSWNPLKRKILSMCVFNREIPVALFMNMVHASVCLFMISNLLRVVCKAWNGKIGGFLLEETCCT